MPEGAMKAWIESSHLSGANAAYIEELYESYLDNSQSVSAEWREVFEKLPKIEGVDVEYRHSEIRDEFRALAKQPQKTVVVSSGGSSSSASSSSDLSFPRSLSLYFLISISVHLSCKVLISSL